MRVRTRVAADPGGETGEVVAPASLGLQPDLRISGQFVDDALDHDVEELLAARDVAVQRHPADPEPLTDGAHRHRGDALLVDQRQCLRHDAFQ